MAQKRGKHHKKPADTEWSVPEQMMIYLQKDEAVFERYGDTEAELYLQMEALENAQNKQNPR